LGPVTTHFFPELYSESTSNLHVVLRVQAEQLLILLREYDGTSTRIRGFWASALCHWASNCRLFEKWHCFLNFRNTHPATHHHIRENSSVVRNTAERTSNIAELLRLFPCILQKLFYLKNTFCN